MKHKSVGAEGTSRVLGQQGARGLGQRGCMIARVLVVLECCGAENRPYKCAEEVGEHEHCDGRDYKQLWF